MFGTNKYKKIKTLKFNSDNERKRFFAIKKYYQAKNSKSMHLKTTKSKTSTNKRK